MNISYKGHVNNEESQKGPNSHWRNDELVTMVKKRKLWWVGHVLRSSGLAKTILQGTMNGKRRRFRQKKRLEDNINDRSPWTLPAQLVQLKQDKIERGCCKVMYSALTTMQCYGIDKTSFFSILVLRVGCGICLY